MKDIIRIFICSLLLLVPIYLDAGVTITVVGGSPAVASGNDFSTDTDVVALWKFESGALTTDSEGGNTLTDNNTVGTAVISSPPPGDGTQAADFNVGTSESFTVTDANLDAGFPLSNGEGGVISVCFWFKAETSVLNMGQWAKGGNGTYSLQLYMNSSSLPRAWQGHTDGTSGNREYISFGSATTDGQWYHECFTYDDGDRGYRMRIWDDNASTQLDTDLTGTFTNSINIEDGDLSIGSENNANIFFDGIIDEVVVFKRELSVAHIDEIRAGTYDGNN